jgi:hypothetical protein
LISGDLNPRLRHGRLIGDVAIVTVAALRDPTSLMTIGLMRGGAGSVQRFRRNQRSSRRQENGDEKSDSRQVGSQAGHDAVLACIGSAKPKSRGFALVFRLRAGHADFPEGFSPQGAEFSARNV